MSGKKIRIERILDRNSGKTVIIPMDHGVTVGPVAGLIHMQETIRSVSSGGANAIVMHKGLVETALKNRGGMGLILHGLSSPKNSRPQSHWEQRPPSR